MLPLDVELPEDPRRPIATEPLNLLSEAEERAVAEVLAELVARAIVCATAPSSSSSSSSLGSLEEGESGESSESLDESEAGDEVGRRDSNTSLYERID